MLSLAYDGKERVTMDTWDIISASLPAVGINVAVMALVATQINKRIDDLRHDLQRQLDCIEEALPRIIHTLPHGHEHEPISTKINDRLVRLSWGALTITR